MLTQTHQEGKCFSSNQLLSSVEMLALRYLGVFEIHLLFSWEFLRVWRYSLLILPNVLFMFKPYQQYDFLPIYVVHELNAFFLLPAPFT